MFVTVLSAPFNLEHRNSTALHNVTFPLPSTGLTCCRSTYGAVSLATVSVCPQKNAYQQQWDVPNRSCYVSLSVLSTRVDSTGYL